MLSAKFETRHLLLEKDDNKCDYLSRLVYRLKIDHEEIQFPSHIVTCLKNEFCHLYRSFV